MKWVLLSLIWPIYEPSISIIILKKKKRFWQCWWASLTSQQISSKTPRHPPWQRSCSSSTASSKSSWRTTPSLCHKKVFFLIFILFMALVFMNLLLGLAVSDIAELERVSCVSDSVLGNFYPNFTLTFAIYFALEFSSLWLISFYQWHLWEKMKRMIA